MELRLSMSSCWSKYLKKWLQFHLWVQIHNFFFAKSQIYMWRCSLLLKLHFTVVFKNVNSFRQKTDGEAPGTLYMYLRSCLLFLLICKYIFVTTIIASQALLLFIGFTRNLSSNKHPISTFLIRLSGETSDT